MKDQEYLDLQEYCNFNYLYIISIFTKKMLELFNPLG